MKTSKKNAEKVRHDIALKLNKNSLRYYIFHKMGMYFLWYITLCGIYFFQNFKTVIPFWDCLTEVYLDTGEGETELFDRLEEIIEEEGNVQDEEFDEVFYNCKFSEQVKEIVKSRNGSQLKSHLEEIKYILEVGK